MNKKPVSKVLLTFISLFSLIIGTFLGAFTKFYIDLPTSDSIISGDLRIHFMELGNNNSGDSILIQIGEYDILVDAGSKSSSLNTIKTYIDEHISDNTLEYVIVTHAHEDHYANFAGDGETSLFSYYTVENIIQFAKTNQTSGKMYTNYLKMVDKEKEEGANVYSALECYNNQNGCSKNIDLGFSVELEILYNYYYENKATSENDYSVCFMINQGDNHFLFTGDLEDTGEEKLVEYNSLPEVVLYKAGHHGSKTSSSEALLSVIKPQIVVVTCVAGSVEYTQNLESTFPTTQTLKRIAKYTDKVYVTTLGHIKQNGDEYDDIGFSSMNGNILVESNSNGVIVTGSNNNTLLKDTDWYKTYRNNIDEWK